MEKFEDLKGKTLVNISGTIGDEEIIFTTNEGEKCKLYYDHD